MTEAEVRAVTSEILRGSWTEEGVRAWFDRPRYQLGGKTPNDILAYAASRSDSSTAAEHFQRVIDLAEAGRSQGAS